MTFKRFILFGLLIISLVAVSGYGYFQHIRTKLGPLNNEAILYIAPGSGVGQIGRTLQKANVIEQPWHFKVLSTVQGATKAIKAGEYVFPPKSTLQAVLDILVSGKTHQRRLVIPEGSSNAQILDILSKTDGFNGVETLVLPTEGHLLPDTYFYDYKADPKDLIEQMALASKDALMALWEEYGDNTSLSSLEDAIILASIIEEETSIAAERPLIASVFLNRLRLRMRLQSDPSVIYGITGGLPLGRRLTSTDLRRDTPYNTYMRYGLPPTAISNPGIEALKAVFAPAESDYLYFVADGTGGHIFAKTLSEHNSNVRKWRKIRDQCNATLKDCP